MVEDDKPNESRDAEPDEVDQAMGEASGGTLKVPAEVEDEPASKDRPEGTSPDE